MDYKLAENLLQDYRVVVKRIRSLSRRRQSVDWLLNQWPSVVVALQGLDDDVRRLSAGSVVFAVLDLLDNYRFDYRYRVFLSRFSYWCSLHSISASRCGYISPVRPLKVQNDH